MSKIDKSIKTVQDKLVYLKNSSIPDTDLIYAIEDILKEIKRIKSIDIYKLVEDAETGQLIHKDKIREFKALLLKELDRDFVTEEYRQSISCYFDNLLEE